MEFRPRNYEEERDTHALARTRSDTHPLSSPATSSCQSDVADNQVEEFLDPLREPKANVAVSLHDLEHAGHPFTKMLEVTTPQKSSTKEWISFKRFLMQRFPVSRTVSISSISDQVLRSGKGLEKLSTIANPDELEDQQKSYEMGTKLIARQEYISRLKELKEKIAQSWRSDDRVRTLKLGIEVAKLLTDTSVGQFYPTLFVLATDIMDMVGDLVWDRIKQKAEFSDDGSVRLCFLPENFQEKDVCSDAKETCYNWFCKIASVRELLPRIYLEAALLPCWRFLSDQPSESLHRLIRMTRGVVNPLLSSYCRLYIVHCAEQLPSFNSRYLITNINDITFTLINATSTKEGSSENCKDSKSFLVSLIEPCIEYIMHHIFVDESKWSVDNILAELRLGNKEIQGTTPSVSVILHHLIKEFPADSVNCKATDIANLIDCCNDYTLDQCLNYRLLGFRLSESKPSDHIMDVINQVVQVVSKWDKLDEYLKVVDAFMDLVLQYHMDNCLVNLLEGISKRTYEKGIAEAELACLQSILVKILLYFKNLEDVFALNHFLEILDMMYGRPQAIVSGQILEKAVRGGFICDPTTIQLLFKVSQALHDSLDYTNARDDDHQLPARLISQFVNMVDYGGQMDQHLSFLTECRGAFGSSNELKEALVHSSNSLAMKASKNALKDMNNMKSCIAFSEVTIPSITVVAKQLNLYIETIELALLGGLLSHVNGLVDSVISCFQSSDFLDGSRGNVGLDDILSSLQKFCSLLVMIPGDPERGLTDTPRKLLMSLDSKAWMVPQAKSRILCAFLILSATLSQKCLPYHASQYGIPGNDILFYGDDTYTKELIDFAEQVISKLVDTLKQEQSHVVRGAMALEARDCIRTYFKVTEDVSETCSELLQMAEKDTKHDSKFNLRSTIDLLPT